LIRSKELPVIPIEIRTSNLPFSVALREHVARRLDFALRRFGSRVELVVVRLVDVNGPRGGPDKRCRLLAHLSPSRTVLVEATAADAYAAVSQAAACLDERVSRALSKHRSRPHASPRPVARPKVVRE
jgi:ribosome-associated translation inhibitor RaiA